MSEIKSLKRKKLSKTEKKTGRFGGVLKNNTHLEESWIWPEPVAEKVNEYVSGYSLNICSGMSKIGDVRLDLEPRYRDVKKEDMNLLPYGDETFDTVISDPPWKISFFQRMKPFFEAVRVCKTGGHIIYNCTWMPISKYVELEKVFLRVDNNWTNISAIWIFRKTKPLNPPIKI